jgi:hypothetical protein
MFSYQASLAEVERIARQEREASHDELCSLKTQHRQEIENIKQDYVAQHSRSKLSELTNKVASLEIVIERLKDKLAKSAEIEVELASKKVIASSANTCLCLLPTYNLSFISCLRYQNNGN